MFMCVDVNVYVFMCMCVCICVCVCVYMILKYETLVGWRERAKKDEREEGGSKQNER